jgi:hypothetical protein
LPWAEGLVYLVAREVLVVVVQAALLATQAVLVEQALTTVVLLLVVVVARLATLAMAGMAALIQHLG